jgi:hypothetical protein
VAKDWLRDARALYMRCMATYGPDKQWRLLVDEFDLTDKDFSPFWLGIEEQDME